MLYISDLREYYLKDVITQLEPGLFKRVMGLDVRDFEMLVSLGLFNGGLMEGGVRPAFRHTADFVGLRRQSNVHFLHIAFFIYFFKYFQTS